MTDIIISFDTEDYTNPEAADAIRDEANLLHEEGITGCFNVVGLLAKQLVAWERKDVLAALLHHEIGLHTYGHSLHPTINEYTDIEDFDAAYREVLRQEGEAVALLRDALGDVAIDATCPPGNSNTYVTMYAYADMGLPIAAGTCCDTMDGRGVFYCNTYHVRYHVSFESVCFSQDEAALYDLVERLAANRRAILYTHPNMALFSQHWDGCNYNGGNHAVWGDWKMPPRRSEEDVQRFYRNMRKLLRILKADKRFRFTTYGEIADGIRRAPRRVIGRGDLPAVKAQLDKALYCIKSPASCSLYDVFMACRAFLRGEEEYACGKAYGFLEVPYAVTSRTAVTAEEMRESAANIPENAFLPTAIAVRAQRLGPADWLYAALEVLDGKATVDVLPKAQMPSLDELPEVRDCAQSGTWVHSPDFADRYLSERLRLQAWTMRF